MEVMHPMEDMRHASECVRLASLTDDIAVRDQLVELAQSWLLAAQQERREAQVIALRPQQSPVGENTLATRSASATLTVCET